MDGEMPLAAGCVYVSGAVTRCRRAAVCCPYTGLLVYGAGGRLICYHAESGSVVGVSKERSDGCVTCVRSVAQCGGGGAVTPTFLATYSSGSAAVWQMDQGYSAQPGTVRHSLYRKIHLQGLHKGSVSCGDCCVVSQDTTTLLIATAAVDYNITLTTASLDTGGVLSSKSYQLKNRSLVLEVRLLSLQGGRPPLLLYGGDDSKVHVWAAPSVEVHNTVSDQIADEDCLVSSNNKQIASLGHSESTSTSSVLYEDVATLPGHQDWVTAIDHITMDNGDVMIASGSKDGVIRVWRLQLSPGVTDSAAAGELRVAPIVLLGGRGVALLDTVLTGHDGWLAHLSWQAAHNTLLCDRNLRLVSCSQTEDRAIVVWQPRYYVATQSPDTCCSEDTPAGDSEVEEEDAEEEEVWVESARLGEVGGNREGFFSAMFSPCGQHIYAHSYQGGLHQWQYKADAGWIPQPTATGHYLPVVDIAWEALQGRYLLSSSLDQTTRLHAPVQHEHLALWHEVCRPQVHGYDLSCVASVSLTSFVAGAEEKLLRAFAAPTNLLNNLNDLCSWDAHHEIESAEFVEAAAVPSLGLSNKSVAQQDSSDVVANTQGNPPVRLTEDSLMAGSLWPEVGKLYGHGHELMCVAATHNYLATACRAATPHDAAIIIWCSQRLQQVQQLHHHRLTVTQLCFTVTGDKLLAVSRDRGWSLYAAQHDTAAPYSLLSHSGLVGKAEQHSRIIWAAAWLPSGAHFVTASRDKNVAVWGPQQQDQESGDSLRAWCRVSSVIECDEVTAVAVTNWAPGKWLIAAGLVTGITVLHVYGDGCVESSHELQPYHHDTVRRLAFKPNQQPKSDILLASCANDGLVCLYTIQPAL